MWTTPEARPVGAAGGLILVTTDELQEAPGVVVCAAAETARAADPDRTVTVTVLDPATGEERVRLQRPEIGRAHV